MSDNPYQSPLTPPERQPQPRPHRELRPIIGVPGAALMFLFGGMISFLVVAEFGQNARLTLIIPALMAFLSIAGAVMLVTQMARQVLRAARGCDDGTDNAKINDK